jgi:hypothetical protein
VANSNNFIGFEGTGALYGIAALNPTISAGSRHLVAIVKYKGDIQFNFATDIAFTNVPGTDARPAVVQLLLDFSAMCRSIADCLVQDI